MNAQDIERLVRRLEASTIAECDFGDHDGSRLRLRFDAAGTAPVAAVPGATPVAARPVPTVATAKAPRFGHFLLRHPLVDSAPVQPGRAVQAGDTVGFIKAGEIVVPVTAAHSGTVGRVLVADNTLVGYGQALMTIA